ncbi:MAG: hypothetical protein P4N24_15425 [Acidobacteriota bacterium]|nr:hypothetical protein [Acidobacteriota bacterium]
MEILDVLQRVISKLEELEIPYMVSGSAASSFHAFVRTTQDGDLVVAMGQDQLEKFVTAFAPEFYLDRASIRRSLQMGGSFNLIHLESSLKIDFFPLRKRSFSQQEFSRRQPRLLLRESTAPAYVATAEDTILAKLEWFRAGGEVSENQWRDVVGILKVQAGSLDLAYLQQWARELQVGDLLEKALKEVPR